MTVRIGRAACAALIATAWTATAVWADTLEEVEKKIVAAAEKVKSYSADMTTVMEMTNPGMSINYKGTGTLEFMRKGDKPMMHMEMKTEMVQKLGDQETKKEQKLLSISDGEFTYTLSEQDGQKSAVKMKLDPKQADVANKEMFAEWAKENTVKLLPEEKLDGKDVFVIEVTPKQGGGMTGKQVHYFSKEHGLVLKMVVFTADGKPMNTTTFTNVKVGAEFKPDRFVFKAPEGVEVMDMTKTAPPPTAPKP